MDTVRFDFYRQEYALLMRAITRAVDALDKQEPERARKLLADAWDTSVITSYKTFVLETDP